MKTLGLMMIFPWLMKAEIAPASFFFKCGEMKIRFDQKKFWNMNLIEYKGKKICIDEPGAHYGTVLKFPGIGFIGSGHTENESEKIISLEAILDEETIDIRSLKENAILSGRQFKLIRKSRIKNIKLENHLEISLKTITETVKLYSDKKVKLSLMYNFMHPWSPQMEYMAKPIAEEITEGKGVAGNKFCFEKSAEWVAVYSDEWQVCVVSMLLESCKQTKTLSILWDRSCYLKHYSRSFYRQEFPAKTAVIFKMVTKMFEADSLNWKQKVKNIVEKAY